MRLSVWQAVHIQVIEKYRWKIKSHKDMIFVSFADKFIKIFLFQSQTVGSVSTGTINIVLINAQFANLNHLLLLVQNLESAINFSIKF